MTYYITNNTLAHHGIKGQKWGVRRYQNPDGTLTEEGRTHYSTKSAEYATKAKTAPTPSAKDREIANRAERTKKFSEFTQAEKEAWYKVNDPDYFTIGPGSRKK